MNTLSDYSIEQAMPANLDAERSILGGILLESRSYDEAAALGLTPSEFFVDSHRKIYSAIAQMREAGRAVDLITLPEELTHRRELQSVGDTGYIASLIDGVPDRPSIKHYVRIVREKAAQRKLVHACNAGIGAIVEGSSSSQAIEALGEQILQIQTGSDDAPARRVAQFSDEVYNAWEKLADGAGEVIGLSTGVDSLDVSTTGIRDGELWLLSGRTGDGKTALALQMAAESCGNDIPVGLFTLEMRRGDLLQRLWCAKGNVPFSDIRYPRHLSNDTRERVKRAMCAVGQWPLFVVEDSSLSLQKFLAKARLLIRQEKVRLLIVDYVQIMSAGLARDERERITKISNGLRAMAKDTGIPIVAISQLNRPRDGNPNIRPNKFSLKESGSLEQDAHVIVLTYRPVDEVGNPTEEDELIIAKQRHGPVANERVRFDSRTLTFRARLQVGR